MKKIASILTAALAIMAMFPTTVHADRPPVTVTEVCISGGRPAFLGLLGPLRYKDVYTDFTVSYSTNPETNEITEIRRWIVNCTGEGNNKCKKTLPQSKGLINGHLVSLEGLAAIEEELVDNIQAKLLNESTFQPQGAISRTVCVTDDKGYRLTLLFQALWKNGKENGDADITINLFDITQEVNLN